jgi:hypothetical protein
MDLLKKATSRKIPVEPGEEKLHRVINFKNKEGRKVRVIAGLDGGSTQFRVTILDFDQIGNFLEELSVVYAIPSASKTVPDNRAIAPKGDFIYDNLDSRIVNTSIDGEVLFENVRLVRGIKATDVELKENRLKSTTQKSQDATFYYNLLDMMGIGTCQKYEGEIPTEVEVYLSVALPPDDLNETNLKGLRHNLQSYKWLHIPSGVHIDFSFKAIITRTEPEAAIKAYYAMGEEETPESTLHIEGGGRSIGAEILNDGISLSTAQKTLKYGGKQLREELNRLYVDKYGGGDLGLGVLENALRTGRIKDGGSLISVMPLIEQVKRTFAYRIVDDLIDKVFDTQTEVGIRDLNTVSISGRLFGRTYLSPIETEVPIEESEPDAYPNGISIADYLAERFKELTPNTEFVHITGNQIPAGLVIEGIIEFSEFEEELDEVAATSELSELVELEDVAEANASLQASIIKEAGTNN